MNGEFDPEATSTRTPQMESDMDPYANPQPGTSSSSVFIIDRPPPLITPTNGKSPKKWMKKTPKKSPRKSPKKELRRTPSQPAITIFLPKRKISPSPGKSPAAKRSKPKRILGDLTSEEREEAAQLERSLMRDDSSIKEAIVDPDTLSSSAENSLMQGLFSWDI